MKRTCTGTRVHAPRLEVKAHFGRDGAHQAHAAHHLDVAVADAEGALAGFARRTYRSPPRDESPRPRRAARRRAAQFEHHGTHRVGTDLQALGQILVLQADVGEGGEFRLGGHQRPDHHGDREGEQLPAEILEQQIADPFEQACASRMHPFRPAACGWRRVVSGISPAKSSICGVAGRCTPKCRLMRSTTSATREPGGQFAERRHRNPPGLFGNHQREAIGLLGDADGGAMARAQLARERRIGGQRQEAGRRRDAVLLDDHRAIVQRQAGLEDGEQNIARDARFQAARRFRRTCAVRCRAPARSARRSSGGRSAPPPS